MKSCQALASKGHSEESRKFNKALNSFRKHISTSKSGEDKALWGFKCPKSLDCPPPIRTLWSGDMCPASPVFSDSKPSARSCVYVCVWGGACTWVWNTEMVRYLPQLLSYLDLNA